MNANLHAALVASLIGALPGPSTAFDGYGSPGLYQIISATDLRPWTVTHAGPGPTGQHGPDALSSASQPPFGNPHRAPDGPRSVRAVPTITRSAETPCCANNLKQIGIATHHYHEAPKASVARVPPVAGARR